MTIVRALAAWLEHHPLTGLLVFFAGLPFILPYHALSTQILTYGLFAMGFNLLYGYTGLLSFGHAAYFGLGAYGTGLALARMGLGSPLVALGMGIIASGAGAAIIGFMCMRRRGVYFGLLTLAFAQLLYFIVYHMGDITGGEDGLRGFPSLVVLSPALAVLKVQSSEVFETREAKPGHDPVKLLAFLKQWEPHRQAASGTPADR